MAFLRPEAVNASELEYIAFSGRSDVAHGIFRSIPETGRHAYANKYILHEVVVAGITKLRTYLAASAEEAAADEKAFLDDVVALFVTTSRHTGSFPRELFETMLRWSEELIRLSLLREALHLYDEMLDLNATKFPDLYVRCIVGKAGVLNMMGKFRETETLLAALARRPYRVTDRNMIPSLLFNLGQESLLRGDIEFYKTLLFRGLRHFYTDISHRRLFVDQIRKTYRRSHAVLLNRRLRLGDKFLFALHRLYFIAERFRVLRLTGAERVLRYAVLGCVYGANYFVHRSRWAEDGRQGPAPHLLRRSILITRAMGGIGDLLMMTPGLHELKRRHPQSEIHLAIPRRYFPVFHDNPDVHLLDIEQEAFDHLAYKKWLNFTDCPASRVEARTAPKVKKNRIELFARGMGLGRMRVRRMEKRPRYFVSPPEREFQRSFWAQRKLEGKRVIGVQLHADEVYRDYPHMPQLIARLAEEYHVLVFDVEPIACCDGPDVTKVEGLPLRQAFALASACDGIIAPDSSFVHLAAAFDLPCVALHGPIDGKLRTMHYPHCRYLDVRQKLGCMPCWRNNNIPCKLTNMRTSVCMADIALEQIIDTLKSLLREHHEHV